MATPSIAKRLDVQGFLCPLPVFRTKRAIGEISVGQVLEVWTTDPMSKIDIPAWAGRDGHELLAVHEMDGGLRFLVKRLH